MYLWFWSTKEPALSPGFQHLPPQKDGHWNKTLLQWYTGVVFSCYTIWLTNRFLWNRPVQGSTLPRCKIKMKVQLWWEKTRVEFLLKEKVWMVGGGDEVRLGSKKVRKCGEVQSIYSWEGWQRSETGELEGMRCRVKGEGGDIEVSLWYKRYIWQSSQRVRLMDFSCSALILSETHPRPLRLILKALGTRHDSLPESNGGSLLIRNDRYYKVLLLLGFSISVWFQLALTYCMLVLFTRGSWLSLTF